MKISVDLINQITEPNLSASIKWAEDIGSPMELPLDLQDKQKRADFVDKINHLFGNISGFYGASEEVKNKYVKQLANEVRRILPRLKANNQQIANLTFRLWCGCLSAAKTIALRTRSGVNTPESRKETFEKSINPIALSDEIYKAGVGAAKHFKKLKKEPISLSGVPENSIR